MSAISKKRILLLIGGIIAALVIIAVIIFFFFLSDVINLFQGTSPPAQTTRPAVTTGVPPTTTGQTAVTGPSKSTGPGADTLPASTTTAPAAPLTPAPTANTPAEPTTPVPTTDIKFDILSVDGSGFNRTVMGQLTNTGTIDLHHAKLKIEMFSRGRLIENDGEPSVEKDLGALKAGGAVTESVAIKLSFIDGLEASRNGITFVLTFTSDEKTQTLSLYYGP